MASSSTIKVHVEHLKKSFGNLEVLKDINIDITEGEVVTVIGPSGSGKSTFLRCLNRLETLTGGKVLVNGFDLGDKKIEVFETPGHTEGCLCFLSRSDRIMFSGDTFNPLMLMFLAHATSIEEYRETQEKLLKIDGYDVFWPSHLSAPLTREDGAGIMKTADKILKQKHNFFLPSIFIKTVDKMSIIYRPDHVRRKKKEKQKQG